MEVYKFLSGLLSEAFKQSLYPRVQPEDRALLDAYGRVIQAGGRAREAFSELFGPRFAENPGKGEDRVNTIFKSRFRTFLYGPRFPGCGELKFASTLRNYTLSFSFLDKHTLRIYLLDEPQVQVTVRPDGPAPDEGDLLDIPRLVKRYGFYAREADVLRGVYRGFTNKDIGITLGIEEVTVKRHVYNIFEKTGVHSRSMLVLTIGTG